MDVTVTSTYTLIGHNVAQVGNLVAGCITITNGFTVLPANTWITVGHISKVPTFDSRFPVIKGNDGSYGGMCRIMDNGDINVFLVQESYNLQICIAYKTN